MADHRIFCIQISLFSGRPDPGWQPTPDEEAKIRGMVCAQTVKTAPLNRLGYRGVRLAVELLGDVWATSGSPLERYCLQLALERGLINEGTFHRITEEIVERLELLKSNPQDWLGI